MNKLKIGVFVLLALMLVLSTLLGACAKEEAPSPEEPIVIRCTSHYPPFDASVAMMTELETLIPAATGGRVKFEQYHGGSLYGRVEGQTAVQTGEVQMTFGATEIATLSPGWDAFCFVPFLFDDDAHMERFLETDAFKALLDRDEAVGFKQVAYLGNMGTINVYNNKHPIEKLEDFKGVKFTVHPTETVLATAAALGMDTVMIPPEEAMTAMETGMLNGFIAMAAAAAVFNFVETCPYLTICNMGQAPLSLVINTTFWNNLPSDIRQQLEGVFAEYEQRSQTMLKEQEKAINAAFAAGSKTVVVTLTAAEKARWVEAVKPVWAKAMGDPNVKELMDAIESVR